MPRYFFDTFDGAHHLRDEQGTAFLGVQEAWDAAARLLPDIARDMAFNDHCQRIVGTVRDEHGLPLFRVTLSLETEWLENLPGPKAAM